MTIGVADDTKTLCVEEYKKDPKLKPEDIQLILDWLKKQAHLPQIEGNELDENLSKFINVWNLKIE
jgi:hypothetical protein